MERLTGRRDASVVVVGAGVAGLAAAGALRRGGASVTVVEAAGRIGGRAWTSTPAELQHPFDHGASWLHAADRNPLVAMARRLGETLVDTEATRIRQTRRGGAEVTGDPGYDRAETAFQRAVDQRLALPGDTSLAEAAAPAAQEPWLPSVLNWEGPVIAAADSRRLSLRDWHANLLLGANMEVPGGLGAFIARHLAPAAGPVRLGTAVTAITWDAGGVRVATAAGTIAADACIVTVSTGVLRSGAIRFTPELPGPVQQALQHLPMGVLNKVAFRAAGPDRLGLPESCGIDQFVAAVDDPAMTFIAWPHGADHVIGFMGGSAAEAMDRDGGAVEHARQQLAGMLGHDGLKAFRPEAVATRWASDRLALGSYAYAVPGGAGARAILGEPLAGGRLVFAGEAVRTDGLAGTVGGAFLAGEAAAAVVTASVAG